MRRFFTSLIGALTFASSTIAALDIQASAKFGVLSTLRSQFEKVAVRPDGSILVIGEVGDDLLIANYSAAGLLLASRRWDSQACALGEHAVDLCVTPNGTAYVVSERTMAGPNTFDILKISPSLNVLWEVPHTGSQPRIAASDTDVYLADNAQLSFRVRKLDSSTGQLIWSRLNFIDTEATVNAVKVQASGTVLVGGQSGGRYRLARLDSSGVLLANVRGASGLVSNIRDMEIVGAKVIAVGYMEDAGSIEEMRFSCDATLANQVAVHTSQGQAYRLDVVGSVGYSQVEVGRYESLVVKFDLATLAPFFSTPLDGWLPHGAPYGDGSAYASVDSAALQTVNGSSGVPTPSTLPFYPSELTPGAGASVIGAGIEDQTASISRFGITEFWKTSSSFQGFGLREPMHAVSDPDGSIYVVMKVETNWTLGKFSVGGAAQWLRSFAAPAEMTVNNVFGLVRSADGLFAGLEARTSSGATRVFLHKFALGNGSLISVLDLTVGARSEGEAMALHLGGEMLISGAMGNTPGSTLATLWWLRQDGTVLRVRSDGSSNASFRQVRSMPDGRAALLERFSTGLWAVRVISANGAMTPLADLGVVPSEVSNAQMEIDTMGRLWTAARQGTTLVLEHLNADLTRRSIRELASQSSFVNDFTIACLSGANVACYQLPENGRYRLRAFNVEDSSTIWTTDLQDSFIDPKGIVSGPNGSLTVVGTDVDRAADPVWLGRFSSSGALQTARTHAGSPYHILKGPGGATWSLAAAPTRNRGHETYLARFRN